jgi:hypothetical protein
VTGGIDKAIEKIEEVFEYIESWDPVPEYVPVANYAKNNIKIMRIVPGVAIAKVIDEDGKWVAVINDGALNWAGYLDIIGGAFHIFAHNNM